MLSEAFSKKLSVGLNRIYWKSLNHLTDEELTKAVECSICESEFFPTVAKLLKFVPKRPPLRIEQKPTIEYCGNTRNLLEKYGDKTCRQK